MSQAAWRLQGALTKRKRLLFETLDETKLKADRLAIEGKRGQAEKLLDDAPKLDGGKIPKYLGLAGKVLGPLRIGLGVYNDYKEGETGTQNLVSQGGGFLAGAGTGMAIGAAVGSVVPVAGHSRRGGSRSALVWRSLLMV